MKLFEIRSCYWSGFFKEESENQETVKEEIEETSMVEDRSEHKGSLFCIFFNNWR